MDLLSLLASILVIFTIWYLKKTRSKTKKNQINTAPEPPGALPFIGHLHLLGGKVHVARILGAMADKHGSIFSLRLGSNHGLVLSNWEHIKECFTTYDRIFASRPDTAVAKYMGYEKAVFALASYGPFWREIRKMVTLELMTANRLEQLKHFRVSEVDHLIKTLYFESTRITKRAVSVSKFVEQLTLNITIRMLAGKRVPLVDCSEEDRRLKEIVTRELHLAGIFVVSDVIPAVEWLDIGGYLKEMKEAAKDMDGVLEEWVEARIRTRKENTTETGGGGESDFLDVMLSYFPENSIVSGFDRKTLVKATLLILILTGSESTAETLTWALSLLLNNPHALRLVQEELDTKIGKQKWVEESDIKNLSYLQAVVKETLRLYPPGPLAGPHEAAEACNIGGYNVPQGTRLIVNLWKLHRDPNVWSNPNAFLPERFLNEHKNLNYRGQNFEYIPFSAGRRMCPAVTFGLQVVQLTLARLLQGFDVSTPMGESVDMEEGIGLSLPKLKPLEVVLNPRLSPELYLNL